MDENFGVRRKLLSGALAAPVVLTVSSASAATSSFARCLANPTADGAGPFFLASQDGWFRAQVPVAQLKKGFVEGYYYLDPVLSTYVSIDPPYTSLGFGATLDPGWQQTGSSTRWALVWFDKATTTQYSKITLQKPSGSIAASISCYGSFNQ